MVLFLDAVFCPRVHAARTYGAGANSCGQWVSAHKQKGAIQLLQES
jgi:hypothetical protein